MIRAELPEGVRRKIELARRSTKRFGNWEQRLKLDRSRLSHAIRRLFQLYFLAPNDIRLQGTRVGIETILYDYIFKARTPEEIELAYSRYFDSLSGREYQRNN